MAAIVGSPRRTTSSPAPTPAPSQSQTQTYFEIVTSNLLKLGALTLEDFLRDPYQEPTPQETFLSNPLYPDAPIAPPLVLDDNPDGDENGKPAQMPAPIFVLHQICSQTFGSIDALDYEIIEEEGKEKKRCILTITRPNGATRSYTSKPEFSRKAEARAAAAAIAVDMGAIDFIKHGSPEAVAKRGLVLAPLDAPGSVQEPSPDDAEEDPAVKEIERCCVEWRAGRVKPRWIFLIDSKPNGKYGCALQVKLSMHLFRVFSVDVVHPTFEAAKATCAADAIAEGILDFIKFGNGQTTPAERRLFQEDDTVSAPPPIALTLQGFFEALPRPLPEPVDDKAVTEINAPGWLNGLLQSARGGKFEHKFIWTTDTKLGTHGAVLRLTRPGEGRTYMVEPQFPKRADAKNAVCLASLAAGVGAYVRSVSAALEMKISRETKTLVLENILPFLTAEYAKYWPNKLPDMFEHTKDRDACGCILTLKLTGEPEEHEKRSWTVPADFRNRNDAKVAVVQLAFEQGAIEFLRFRGEPPPEGYKVELPAPRESKKAKRKGTDGAENEGEGTKKKLKLLSQSEQFLASTSLPAKPTVSSRPSTGSFSQAKAPTTSTTSNGAMLLPRPGYIDPKPEPGELPSEPPKQEPEHLPASLPRRPTTQPLEYPPRHAIEPLSYHRPRGDSTRPTPYDTREHGRQYEPGNDSWDEGPGAYASDPYYAPPPASHMEPWNMRHSGNMYPEEEGYRQPYYDADYGHGYDYDLPYHGYDYDCDYERDPYAALPPRPPPVSGPAHGYADFEHSGYDHGYFHDRGYSHDHGHMQHPPPPPPPHPTRTELATAPMSEPRRGGPPSRSPPRVWQPGPRAAVARARRGDTGEPRPPPTLLPRASASAEPRAQPESSSAAVSSSSSSSSSSTPADPLAITRTPPQRVAKPTPSPSPGKDELLEYCRIHGYPRPQFFVSMDDSGKAGGVELGVAPTTATVAASAADVRYKVWVVLGPERLELPTTYAGIKEGEEKMARKVLRHLRSRDVGEGQEL